MALATLYVTFGRQFPTADVLLSNQKIAAHFIQLFGQFDAFQDVGEGVAQARIVPGKPLTSLARADIIQSHSNRGLWFIKR